MTTPRSAIVLANPGAGSTGADVVEQVLSVLEEHARVELVDDLSPESLASAVDRLGGRDLVVVGGDGSVHAALLALAERDALHEPAAVGIVPLGTGNDLARALGLPEDPLVAARVALEGRVVELDLLRDDHEGVVVNAVHAGVGAEATANAAEVKGVLGTAAYAVGAVRAGAVPDGWHLRVTVDGQVVHDGTRECLMVTVAVGRYIGGGTPVAPGSDPDDRVATVVVSLAVGAAERVAYALALREGTHTQRDDVVVAHGREVLVEAVEESDAFPVNTDGEVGPVALARTWRLQPAAWRCRVPA